VADTDHREDAQVTYLKRAWGAVTYFSVLDYAIIALIVWMACP
jgi:hypothetical protein